MSRKNRTPEENERRAKIRELLQMGGISSMDDIQNLFKCLYILVGYVLCGVPELVNDAVLNLGFWEHGFNGIGKAGEIIRTGDENVLYAAISQAVEHICPVLGALVFAYPHTENVLPAVQIDTNGNVNCLFNDLSLAADVEMDGVQKYDRVDALQRPLLPFFCHGQDLVRDSADGRVGHLYAVDVMDAMRFRRMFTAICLEKQKQWICIKTAFLYHL